MKRDLGMRMRAKERRSLETDRPIAERGAFRADRYNADMFHACVISIISLVAKGIMPRRLRAFADWTNSPQFAHVQTCREHYCGESKNSRLLVAFGIFVATAYSRSPPVTRTFTPALERWTDSTLLRTTIARNCVDGAWLRGRYGLTHDRATEMDLCEN
jgi:hypothetical protein